MPLCKDCKWYTPSGQMPTIMGLCRVVKEAARIPSKFVKADEDTGDCARFEIRTGKYIE